MTTAELKEYLGMVVQMEKELYVQQQLEKNLVEKIQMLRNCTNEQMQLHESLDTFCLRNYEGYQKTGGLAYIKDDAFIDAPPVKPAGQPHKPETTAGFQKFCWALIIILLMIAGAGKKPIVLVGIPLVWYICSQEKKENKKIEEAYYRQLYQYKEELRCYQEDLERYNKRKTNQDSLYKRWVEQKERAKAEMKKKALLSVSYEVLLQKLKGQQVKTKKAIEKIYGVNIVYPKYRSYVAVCSFYEYIASGRCSRLDGSDGAYNKFDIETRMDKIITQLDTVIQNLEQIRQNQYMLYVEMKNAEEKILVLQGTVNQISKKMNVIIAGIGAVYEQGERHNAQLNWQLQKIQSQTEELLKTSELAAYFEACNQRELHYMNRMNYLAGHYDNPYGNYAPV